MNKISKQNNCDYNGKYYSKYTIMSYMNSCTIYFIVYFIKKDFRSRNFFYPYFDLKSARAALATFAIALPSALAI